MTLQVYTARVSYGGPDRLDVTRKSAGPDGLPFAPSWAILGPALARRRAGLPQDWDAYAAAYTAEMRASYRAQRPAWDALLARERVTLVCYCTASSRCHRTTLAEILAKLGATTHGEVTHG